MSITRTSAALALSVAVPALVLAMPAAAQNVTRIHTQAGATQVETLPPMTPPLTGTVTTMGPAIATAGTSTFKEERTVGPDGVETIIRTRFIRGTVPGHQIHQPTWHSNTGVIAYPVMAGPVVLERDGWINECNRRIDGRSERDKAQLIGGLLGAIGGGILGNVLSDGNRLGGTLLGAGAGGLAGVGLGSLLGGGKKGGRYDCEAALDGYMAYYSHHGAIRAIPPGYGYAHSGHYGYSEGCGCQQPQMVLVPIRHDVRQRVIVREETKEILVPGKPVKHPPKPVKPHPIKPSKPSKLIKR